MERLTIAALIGKLRQPPKEAFKLDGQHGAARPAVAVLKRMDPLEPNVKETQGGEKTAIVTKRCGEQMPGLVQRQFEFPLNPRRVRRRITGNHRELTGCAELTGPGMDLLEEVKVNRLKIADRQLFENLRRAEKRQSGINAQTDGFLVLIQSLNLREKRQSLDLIPSVGRRTGFGV